jgi:hypothetical protein
MKAVDCVGLCCFLLVGLGIYGPFPVIDACLLNDQGGPMLFDQARNATLFALKNESNINTRPYHNPYKSASTRDASGMISTVVVANVFCIPGILLYTCCLGIMGAKKMECGHSAAFLVAIAIYMLPNVLQSFRNEVFREVGRFAGYYETYLPICANHTELQGCDRFAQEDLSFQQELASYALPGTLSVSYWFIVIRTLLFLVVNLSIYCFLSAMVACNKRNAETTVGVVTPEEPRDTRIIIPVQRVILPEQRIITTKQEVLECHAGTTFAF